MAAHKWAAEMHAFADGGKIQSSREGGAWLDDSRPDFCEPRLAFRVRPAESEGRNWFQTDLTDYELKELYSRYSRRNSAYWDDAREMINEAFRYAQGLGQFVTREEFDNLDAERKTAVESFSYARKELERANGDRKVRDLAVARAVAERVAKGIEASLLIGSPDSTFDLLAIIAEVKP